MPYKIFTNGSSLPASDLNTYLSAQVIAVFADATARDAAITSPTEGQFAYLTGTDALVKYNGSAWVDAIPTPTTAVSEQSSSFTISAGQAGSYVYVTGAATITVNDNLAIGETINVIATTADTVTFAAGSGVTLNSKDAKLSIGGQYSGASLTKKATNTYFLVGDLA